MADVFISYARATEAAARKLADALISAGYSVWFDDEIPAYRAYSDVISEKLEAAKAVVVLWSAQAAGSQWVRSEANRAREKGTLIQARLDDVRLPMPFDQIQYLDFQGWRGSQKTEPWRRLIESIDSLVASGHFADLRPESRRRILAPTISRRPLLIGVGAALAAGMAAALGWRELGKYKPSPEADLLIQKARTVLQDGGPEDYGQATAYLLEATRLDPRYAEAWGTLAFSYALSKYQVPLPARQGQEARCRSAARTAFELDSDEPFASCALVLLRPAYRNWRHVEPLCRELAERFGFMPLAPNMLADTLADLGRWREAVAVHDRMPRERFRIPLSHNRIIQSLWSSGDIQRTETVLTEAVERWPKHEAIWNLRVKFLTHSGRAEEAVRLLEDASARPPNYPEALHRSSLLTARAIAGSDDRDAAIQANLAVLDGSPPDYLRYLNHKISMTQMVAQRCAALGNAGTAFELLDGYYFGRGPWAGVAPPAGDEDRATVSLFEPPMSGLWRDPRFGRLLTEIGLDDYWRDSGMPPDFRQA